MTGIPIQTIDHSSTRLGPPWTISSNARIMRGRTNSTNSSSTSAALPRPDRRNSDPWFTSSLLVVRSCRPLTAAPANHARPPVAGARRRATAASLGYVPSPPKYCSRTQSPSSDAADLSSNTAASLITSAGTHSGNGVSSTTWWPRSVCLSRIAANRSFGNLSASRTSAGQRRRCTRVTLPETSLQTCTSGQLRTSPVNLWMAWPFG